MKTIKNPAAHPILTPMVRAALLAGLAVTGVASLSFGQAVVNPDPEIFDGTKTKREAIKETPQTAVDDWEGPNLIIYDTNGQSPEGESVGGTGMGDGTQPGLDIGISGGPSIGIPNPLGGGGIGGAEPAIPSLEIPTGQQSSEGGGQKNADTSGAAQSANRPADVSIGDDSQRITTTAQGQIGNAPGKPEPGETGTKEAGEDSTKVPSAASMPQSGNRGGGVEVGDAMPPDM